VWPNCCFDTCNEVNVDFVKSVYSMNNEAENSHLLYVTLQGADIVGNKREGEKERMRE
jgi:hypothetical protein